jgi:hypothetical protein
MKVFLDDERATPDGWERVYWHDEALRLLESGAVTEISLDYDLGGDTHGTGYDVVLWIEEAVALRGFRPPEITVHSANSSSVDKIRAVCSPSSGSPPIKPLTPTNHEIHRPLVRPSVRKPDDTSVVALGWQPIRGFGREDDARRREHLPLAWR